MPGNDSYTKILQHFDGADAATTFPESSLTGGTWTASGGAQLDTAQAKFGPSSLLISADGDDIRTPDHADYTLGSGDWTIDGWFYRSSGDGTDRFVAAQCPADLDLTNTSFLLRLHTTNTVLGQVFQGSTPVNIFSTTTFTTTGWNHVEFSRSGGNLQLFINGTKDATDVAIAGSVNNSTASWTIGSIGNSGLLSWRGWIDELRLSVGIARHTGNFTPETRPYDIFGRGLSHSVALHPRRLVA